MDRLTVYIEGEAREEHTRDTAAWKNGSRACMERLAAYEDTGLTPEEVEAIKAENARLRESRQTACDLADANLETATRATETIKTLGVENTRLRAELEAAKGDIRDMLRAEYFDELCKKCKTHKKGLVCMIGNCDNAEWRGVTENGGSINAPSME